MGLILDARSSTFFFLWVHSLSKAGAAVEDRTQTLGAFLMESFRSDSRLAVSDVLS